MPAVHEVEHLLAELRSWEGERLVSLAMRWARGAAALMRAPAPHASNG